MAQQLAVYSAVLKLLQPTEIVKLAIEVNSAQSVIKSDAPVTGRSFIAVISNISSSRGVEEAARPNSPIIIDCLPIFNDFQLSISQYSPPSTSTAVVSNYRFSITVTSTRSQFSFLAEDIAPLTDLITEIKRLQGIARASSFSEGSSHSWMSAYQKSLSPPTRTGSNEGIKDIETVKRFDTVSAAYSMIISEPTGEYSDSHPPVKFESQNGNFCLFSELRRGLSDIDWGNGTTSKAAAQNAQIQDVRARWLVNQIKLREDEFTRKEDIRIYVGTFNVNDKLPTEDLSPWILPGITSNSEILAFGFQELDLSAEALLRYTPNRSDAWSLAIEKGLGPHAALYQKIHTKQLVGLLLHLYVLKSSLPSIDLSSIASSSVATGILGLVANKGAVAIRLKFKDTYITILTSHLAAFTNQVEKRNLDFKEISKGLRFTTNTNNFVNTSEKLDAAWTPDLDPSSRSFREEGAIGIWDSHHLIWMGDLNYRIDLARADVIRMIKNEEWEMLARFDQLKIQQSSGIAWSNFSEAPLEFPPTYKYDVGTQEYDSSEKQRVPSWTDRVLTLSLHENTITSIGYKSFPEITISDHKPVSALLQVQVCSIIPEQRIKVQREVMNELDKFENDSLPDVKISPSPAIQFDLVEYLRPASRQIEIINIGTVVAQWQFVPKPGFVTLTPSWLHLSPTSGLILPGEKSVVNITISIDNLSLPSLNFASEPSELLILSIEKKDLFLSVSTREFKPTCFGNSLQRLIRLGKPIRRATVEELEEIGKESGRDQVVGKSSIPLELHRILSFLAEYSLDVKDLFLVQGDQAIVRKIRECLDTGDQFPLDQSIPTALESVDNQIKHVLSSDIASLSIRTDIISAPLELDEEEILLERDLGSHCMADTLVKFLESLAEPVINWNSFSQAIRVESKDEAYRVVEGLDDVNANTLLYIIAFLRVLMARTVNLSEREAKINRIAVVFSAVLLRPNPIPDISLLDINVASIPRRKKAFVLYLLTEDEVI